MPTPKPKNSLADLVETVSRTARRDKPGSQPEAAIQASEELEASLLELLRVVSLAYADSRRMALIVSRMQDPSLVALYEQSTRESSPEEIKQLHADMGPADLSRYEERVRHSVDVALGIIEGS